MRKENMYRVTQQGNAAAELHVKMKEVLAKDIGVCDKIGNRNAGNSPNSLGVDEPSPFGVIYGRLEARPYQGVHAHLARCKSRT
ncbi:hypothetical protein TcasGA2_TC001627 [Tribolium castaneum]|uniref:Uncharacterized protein n=1 Tax=Tribolium castaneum TaxID=7070 RepID=D6W6K4_TRICA|nr:hypothetical protein TcasGA2_TC001627 [Tribolium castaneum]